MKYIILLATLMFSQINFAACGNPENVLVFANGMFNDKAEAQSNLDKFRAIYVQKYPTSPLHLSYLAYNTNESLVVQLYEVYTQFISSTGEAFWTNMAKVYPYAHENLKDDISNQAARDANLAEQINAYQKFIDKRYNVITVAHSQGNFYTLSAFTYLDTPATRMISVATPAHSVYDNGPYFTFTTDPIGELVPLSLEPNLKKAVPSAFDHGFMTHYMQDANAKAQILQATNNVLTQAIENQFVASYDEHDGFFNSDMKNVLRWTRKTMSNGSSNESEDLLLESVTELANSNLTCESRNYNQLTKVLNQKMGSTSPDTFGQALKLLKSLSFTL